MQKMWSFSTLQRPTQEEKERRRRWRNENGGPDVKPDPRTKKILRAKTFRHQSSDQVDYNDNLDNILSSLPQNPMQSNNFVEALRHRAKSTSRVSDFHHYDGHVPHKPRREQSIGGFVSRLRFLDNEQDHQSKKAVWQDRSGSGEGGNSSGYSRFIFCANLISSTL